MLQPAHEKQERTKRTVVSRRMPAPSQMPDEYAERLEKFSSIAHGNREAIVGDWMDVGNVERGRAGERDMGVRGVRGVTRCLRPPLSPSA